MGIRIYVTFWCFAIINRCNIAYSSLKCFIIHLALSGGKKPKRCTKGIILHLSLFAFTWFWRNSNASKDFLRNANITYAYLNSLVTSQRFFKPITGGGSYHILLRGRECFFIFDMIFLCDIVWTVWTILIFVWVNKFFRTFFHFKESVQNLTFEIQSLVLVVRIGIDRNNVVVYLSTLGKCIFFLFVLN